MLRKCSGMCQEYVSYRIEYHPNPGGITFGNNCGPAGSQKRKNTIKKAVGQCFGVLLGPNGSYKIACAAGCRCAITSFNNEQAHPNSPKNCPGATVWHNGCKLTHPGGKVKLFVTTHLGNCV
eukprot:8938786-Ditylum_brightwellii.AAC.2